MKINASELISHIEKASINGIINEIVLDEKLMFSASDESRNVMTVCTKGFDSADLGKIGLFDLGLVIRSIQFASSSIFNENEQLEVSVKDNRLVFSKGDNNFKFLLSNPKVISTTVENTEEALKKLRVPSGVQIVLNPKDISKIMSAISLINPETVVISVKEGKVNCLIGEEINHNTNLCIGSVGKDLSLSVKVKPDFFSKVLQTLPTSGEVKLEIRDSYPLIFTSERYTFVLIPSATKV